MQQQLLNFATKKKIQNNKLEKLQKKIQRDNLQQFDSNNNLQTFQSGTKPCEVWCGTRISNFFKQNHTE